MWAWARDKLILDKSCHLALYDQRLMRRSPGFVFWFCSLSVALAALSLRATEPPRSSVLFISIDDLNNSLGCYGNTAVKTPNVDRLASMGIRFDRAYCQYPLCNPSRTSFLSGRYPDTTGIFDNDTSPRTVLKDLLFMPEYFRSEGFFTACCGKLVHGGFRHDLKWDVLEDAAKDSKRSKTDTGDEEEAPARRGSTGTVEKGVLGARATTGPDSEEPDGINARRVAQLLEENREKAFFITAGIHKPHLPFTVPKKYFDMHPPDKIVLPKEPADDTKDIPALALTQIGGGGSNRAAEEGDRRASIAAYYACVSFMDAQVGVLLDTMDRLKLWDKTVVIFMSDHGWHLGEHGGLWKKMSLFEPSARVPMIMVVPGMKTGVSSERLVELVDLYPTLAELCGLPKPEGVEGISLVPLLQEPNRPWKKAAYTIVSRGKKTGRSVRTEDFRYTEWGDPDSAELYDHRSDPYEYTNLVTDPRHASTLKQMRQLLADGWKAARPDKPL